tara:strand:- start:906 stop:1130 length:225 start_codon:yes stop_codon:yes gene_type:complete
MGYFPPTLPDRSKDTRMNYEDAREHRPSIVEILSELDRHGFDDLTIALDEFMADCKKLGDDPHGPGVLLTWLGH